MKASLFGAFALSLCIACALSAQTPLWQRTNGPGGADITGITFDSSGGAIVLSNRAFRTTDGGATWEQLPILPSDLHTLPNGDLVAAINGKVSISTDHGHTWNVILDMVRHIATTTTGEIFVIANPYLLRSSNEGLSWDTLSSPPVWDNIFAFNSSVAFVLGNNNGTAFIYRSTNNGANWSKVVNGLILDYNDGQLCGTIGGILYFVSTGGFYISTDDGRTWKSSGSNYDVHPLVAMSGQGIVAYSSRFHLKQIDQNGKVIKDISYGFPASQVDETSYSSLAVSPSGEFWMTYGSLIGKVDPRTHNVFSVIAPPTGTISNLIADASGNIVADSKWDHSATTYPPPSYMYRTSDAGLSWSVIPNSTPLSPLVIDSSHSILTSSQGQIYRSSDNGSTWKGIGSMLTSGQASSIVVDPQGFIYMGCYEGVFRSTDNGSTWDQLNIGLTDVNVLSLTVNAAGEVFAGTATAIFHSTDHALSWQTLPFTPSGNSGISILTVNTSGDILTVVKDSGVFWSHDDGQNWNPIASGLTGQVNALLSTPSGHVFAGTDSGAFYLPSGSGTWVNANGGLGKLKVLSITRDQAGTVYLGTDGSGVFSSTQTYNIANNSGVAAIATSDISLGHVYPNPMSRIGEIGFSVPEASHVRIELVNVLGERVRLLTDGECGAGMQKININAIGLANGVYHIVMTSGGTRKIERVVISK